MPSDRDEASSGQDVISIGPASDITRGVVEVPPKGDPEGEAATGVRRPHPMKRLLAAVERDANLTWGAPLVQDGCEY